MTAQLPNYLRCFQKSISYKNTSKGSTESLCVFYKESFRSVGNLAVYVTPPASPAWLPVQAFDSPLGQPKRGLARRMEGDEQRRGQYEQSNYPRGYAPGFGGQASNVPNVQDARGASQGDVADRFRQPHLLATQSPTSASLVAGAGSSRDLGSYGYAQAQQYTTPPMHGTSFTYSPVYPQEPQRQRYPQYQSQMMYTPQQHPSPYAPVGQYPPRQSAAVEVLSSQFGVSQQYYNPGEVANVSESIAMPQIYPSSAYQQQMQYNPGTSSGRPTLASSYQAAASSYSQTSTEEAAQPEQESDTRAQQWANFDRAIRETNTNTSRSRLIEAGGSLERLSEWLLTHASGLGLGRDDQDLHAQRVEMWDNFNNCWLALCQRQKDDTQQMLDTGQPPSRGQSLLTMETLRRMGDNLVAHADELERHGLVDYQMGVAEEEILGILRECVTLLDTDEEEDEPDTEAGDPPTQGTANR